MLGHNGSSLQGGAPNHNSRAQLVDEKITTSLAQGAEGFSRCQGQDRIQQINHPPEKRPGGFPWMGLKLDSRFLVALNLLVWLLWCSYFFSEFALVFETLKNYPDKSLWRMWIMILTELGILLPDAFIPAEVILAGIFGSKNSGRARYRLVGDDAPTIDVFITCCGESLKLIADTLTAAASQEYPPQRYRIFVLDDMNDHQLRELATNFKRKASNQFGPLVTYVARKKRPGIRHYFKAGNLRHAFGISARLHDGSEYVAALDADMIVSQDWLRRLIPHLILDDKLALVCPPQVKLPAML